MIDCDVQIKNLTDAGFFRLDAFIHVYAKPQFRFISNYMTEILQILEQCLKENKPLIWEMSADYAQSGRLEQFIFDLDELILEP